MRSENQELLGNVEYYGGLGVAVLGLLTLNPAEFLIGGLVALDGNRRRN